MRTIALRLQTTKFTPLQIRRPIFTPAAQRHPPGVAGPRSCHFCFSFGRSAKRFLCTSPTEIIQYVNSQHRRLFSFTPWPNWRLPSFRLGRPVQLYNGGIVAIPEPQQHFQRCSEALMQPWRHAWRENYGSNHDIQTREIQYPKSPLQHLQNQCMQYIAVPLLRFPACFGANGCHLLVSTHGTSINVVVVFWKLELKIKYFVCEEVWKHPNESGRHKLAALYCF